MPVVAKALGLATVRKPSWLRLAREEPKGKSKRSRGAHERHDGIYDRRMV
jgi:hypothetical protein